jgi:uncharacterized protein
MTIAVGTYLPPWGSDQARLLGYDEDALTMAVEAASLVADHGAAVSRVIFISRELPLLEGGNTAPLLAALRLPETLEVVEQIGGAPAALDALISAGPGTLVIAVDAGTSAGAAAALVHERSPLTFAGRAQRSLPQRTRLASGHSYRDDDPRLLRESGVRASMAVANLPGKPLVTAGLAARDAAAWSADGAPALPTLGASSTIFALAALIEGSRSGLVVASEQAALSAATFDAVGSTLRRHEPKPQSPAARKKAPGSDIKLSLAAYDRAFKSKVGWHAGKCTCCGLLSMPPRYHCLDCGADDQWEFSPLPRSGTVYTTTTVHVPVPSLLSPYTLAIVECDGTDVRALMHVTDVPAGRVAIGAHGRLVLRRVAMRTGVPDYGHAFSPLAVHGTSSAERAA